MKKTNRMDAVDILLLVLAILPLAAGMVMKVLFTPGSADIDISGALIYYQNDAFPLMPLYITESEINAWLVILTILFLCLFLTRKLTVRPETKRQVIAEWVVEQTEKLVHSNMDPYFGGYAPFVAAIMGLSGFCSLLALIGLFTPTSDMNVVGGWAVLVFFLITFYKLKAGVPTYLKSFAQPVALTPMNIISEFATPVSMAFRHYGNVLSGSVISVLIAALLQGISHSLLGWLPGILGEIPWLQIGLPAILSVYFDLFSGCLQAFIFAMLTMLYVSGGFPAEEFAKRKQRRLEKQAAKAAKAA